jgi:BirA family biotin operon repressor/biotin-[acetyl-CoA-carboxylase] ligase
LSAEGRHALPPGWRLRIEESLGSTNDVAAQLAAAGEPGGLAILAHRQTSGRGRDGRAWASPAGNLYLSVLLRPDAAVRDAGHFALAAAVALAEVLEPELPDPAVLRLKWPNDLLLDGAKLAGVLCESSARADGRLDWLVIGMGANLAVAPEVPGRATACLPAAAEPEEVAVRLLRALAAWEARLAAEGFGPLRVAWMRRGPAQGAQLTLRSGTGHTTGSYRGLDDDGALLMQAEGRLGRFASGEVTA